MGVMNFLRRAKPQAKSRATLPILVDGALRPIDAIRADFAQDQSWATGNYSPTQLALVYKTGLTAYSCINIRAAIASEIALQLVDQSGAVVAPPHPAVSLIKDSSRIIWRLLAYRLIFGAFYIRKYRNAANYPSSLEIVSPLNVRPDVDFVTNTPRGYYVTVGGGSEYVPSEDMITSLAFDPTREGIEGLSALEVALTRANVEINIARYAQSFFKNSARPDGILTSEVELDEETQKAVRYRWQETMQGVGNAFRTFIAGGAKWDYKPISFNPSDLAMGDLTDRAQRDICAALAVNPALIGLGQVGDPLSAQGTYQSIRQQHIEFVAIPDVKLICDALNRQWLQVDFDQEDWALQPDLSEVVSASLGAPDRIAAALSANTIWSFDEVRAYTGKERAPYAIQYDPNRALALWQAGLIKRSEARRAVGLLPLQEDGFIWDVDPRAAPVQPAPSFFSEPTQAAPEPQPVLEPQPAARAIIDELRLWEKKIAKRGPQVAFACNVIPPQLAESIRQGLAQGVKVRDVFASARANVKRGLYEDMQLIPDADTVADDAETFWADFDQWQNEVGDAWLQAYMLKVWASVRDILSAGNLPTLDQIKGALDHHVAALTDAWLGTPDKAGALYALALAGIANGEKELSRKSGRALPIGLKIDWTLLSTEALKFIQNYLPTLIQRINQTTLNQVQKTIEAWLLSGEPLSALQDALAPIFNDPVRAQRIAQTETTRLYAEGSRTRFKQRGVTYIRFRTARDSKVCPICAPLRNQVAPIDVGFRSKDGYRIPPMHVGCRCGIRPVIDLDGEGVLPEPPSD